jgi:hypothetical protein
MKTLVILTEIGEDYPKFLVVDGDLRHLNNVYVNSNDGNEKEQQEILDRFYNGGSTGLIENFSHEAPEFPFDFQFIIQCGFLL